MCRSIINKIDNMVQRGLELDNYIVTSDIIFIIVLDRL